MCSSEVPDLNNIATYFEGQDFILFGINVEESPQQVESFFEALGTPDYPILMDLTGEVHADYHINDPDAYAPFPRQFIIDQTGKVTYMASQYYPDLIIENIEDLLANPPETN